MCLSAADKLWSDLELRFSFTYANYNRFVRSSVSAMEQASAFNAVNVIAMHHSFLFLAAIEILTITPKMNCFDNLYDAFLSILKNLMNLANADITDKARLVISFANYRH